jgi:hypothetical protein
MSYPTPGAAPALLLAEKVTRSYFQLCSPQRAAILCRAVVALQYQLMCVDDAAQLEAGIDKNEYQRKLHQKELHLKCNKNIYGTRLLKSKVCWVVNINKITVLWKV